MPIKSINPLLPSRNKFIWLFISISHFLVAQVGTKQNDYLIEKILLNKELTGLEGSSIIQDADGFMWFGTRAGLYRYDGVRFKKYTDELNDQYTISNQLVETMRMDLDGELWVGCYFGFNKYIKELDYFEAYMQSLPRGEDYEINLIRTIVPDSGNTLWLGTVAGLIQYNTNSGEYKHFKVDSIHGENNYLKTVYNICKDSYENLWIREDGSDIFFLKKGNDRLELIERTSFSIQNITEREPGKILLSSKDGMLEFEIKENIPGLGIQQAELIIEKKDAFFGSTIMEDDGAFWVTSFYGIHKYDRFNKLEFEYLFQQKLKPSKGAFSLMSCLHKDASGAIWAMSRDEIIRISEKRSNFKLYHQDMKDSRLVQGLCAGTNDSIWYTDGADLFLLKRDQDTTLKWEILNEEERNITFLREFLLDSFGNFWFGTEKLGAYRGKRNATGKLEFSRFSNDFPYNESIHNSFITKIFEDSKHRIWFSSSNKYPFFYDYQTDSIYELMAGWDIDSVNNGINGIHFELEENVFIGTNSKGIYKLTIPYEDGSVYKDSELKSELLLTTDELGSNYFNNLYMTRSEGIASIWAFSKILIKIDMDSAGITNILKFTNDNGMTIYSNGGIVQSSNSDYWISTWGGLVKYCSLDSSFTVFKMEDGLPSNGIRKTNSVCKDGEIFIGTDNGFISFYPDSIRMDSALYPIYITDLLVNNKPFRSVLKDHSRQILYTDSLLLSYKMNNITIEYALLNYEASYKNQYKYRLTGQDETWVYARHKTEATYTNLRPGKYKFQVQGANQDGIWNQDGTELYIRIKPPLYARGYAFVFYILLLSVIAFLIFNFLKRRAKLKMIIEVEKFEKQKAQEIAALKSRFYTNISHEFRTPLTLLVGPLEDTMKINQPDVPMSRKLLQIMLRNARRLQRLINQLLDISKLESGNMQLQLVKGNLSGFTRTIASSFLSLAESNNITYKIIVEEKVEKVCFDADKTEKIITNLLSNAFKFTRGRGLVEIKLEYRMNLDNGAIEEAVLTVRDSGKGIEAGQISHIFERFYQVSDKDTREAEGSGIGLALTKELVGLMHGNIEVESEPGVGTTFTVIFPVSRECFSDIEVAELLSGENILSEIDFIGTEESQVNEENPDFENEKLILIVEDNADLRNYIREQFKSDFRIVEAKNGRSGLEKAMKLLPDLVISDLMMPVMGGVEMCKELKTHPLTNHIPVVMLTAKADKESKMEGLETGADDYIIKPFDAEELTVRVKNLIHQREILRESFQKNYLHEENKAEASSQYKLLRGIMEVIDRHLGDTEFDLKTLAGELNLSRSQLFRKVRFISDTTPNELLRMIRMKRAAHLLRSSDLNVTQVMYQVGLKNPSHFSNSFKKYFGVNPGEYRGNGNHK